MSPAAEKVLGRLDDTRQTWWLFTLLSTTALAAAASLLLWQCFLVCDALFRLPQQALLVLFVFWLTVSVLLLVLILRRLLGERRSLEATARCVEAVFPEVGSHLINLVQLAKDTKNQNRAFCQAAVDHAASQTAELPLHRAAEHQTRWRRLKYCMQTPRDLVESVALLGAVVLAWVVLGAVLPNWSSAASRLMTPWRFVPSVGQIRFEVDPGDATVLVGQSLPIRATPASADSPESLDATLFVLTEGEESETSIAMSHESAPSDSETESAPTSYTASLTSIHKPLRYRVEVGDSQSPIYHVEVLEKPTVQEVEVTYRYPDYLGRPPEVVTQPTGDLEAPRGTVAVMHIRTTAPITRGELATEDATFSGQVEADGRRLAVKLPMTKSTTYRIKLYSGEYHDPEPRVNQIRVIEDAAPKVTLLAPPRRLTAAPGEEIVLRGEASDDHGITECRFEWKIRKGPDEADSDATDGVERWTVSPPESSQSFSHRLTLDAARVAPGQIVLLRAVATDNRRLAAWGLDLAPQEGSSGWHTIEIIDGETAVEGALEDLDQLRGAIYRLLQQQLQAQARTVLLSLRETADQRESLASDVRAGQVDVQKATMQLVEQIGDSHRKEHVTAKRVLAALAFGPMLKAVEHADTVVGAKTATALDDGIEKLQPVQTEIVQRLRTLLSMARAAQSEQLDEMDHRRSSDLPDDAKKKMDQLDAALDEAMEAQRKVVEAADQLAKAPVEDFSEAQEQLVKAMEAAEDAWNKFMVELNTDLSKLPEQDFANPSLLEELVEIQTEIKMAEDALTEKTKDIAVPLEQLGAEMAEEIQTNLEKWLPDTPDRERWSQEESLTDEGKEAPMAELPGELEDLIGELMEEEEDLFDEMEDISSSAADSLDQGAGWDVADGPISNMSAKGATGNRLPNTSEIGGRAGEGRQGKSSGEFVGNEAVGKGGRKTPTRLAPDPYVAGQIKDHSTDPTGGATGGGKESGQGGEGLEGPQPGFRGQRDLERLAGKQAELRNRAEGIDLEHLRIMGYHHTDLKEMIEVMAQVERDLKAGRYQNALRMRRVLAEGLGDVKRHVAGEFEVRDDQSLNVPTEIRDDLLGSMDDTSPAGWEQINRDYFERLSGSPQGGSSP